MMTISISEAQAIIAADKTAVREIIWQAKKGNYSPIRYEFHTALEIHSEIREDLMFRAQYRGAYQHKVSGVYVPKEENISVGLYAANNRIFAYDYNTTPHKNNIGTGRPYYLHTICGLHKHIWTENGYGYAEPFALTRHDLKSIMEAFVNDSNIYIPQGFRPIPQEQIPLSF